MRRGPAFRRDRTPTGVAHPRPNADEGFTLIEVMAAMFLFLMVSTSTAAILMQGLDAMRTNQDRVTAANVARSEIEYLRDLARKDPGIVPIGQFTGPIPPLPPEGAIPAATRAEYEAALNPLYLDKVLQYQGLTKATEAGYTITTTSNWVNFASVAAGGTSQSACDGESASAAYLRVVVTIDGKDLEEPVSLQTNITQQSKPKAGPAATVGAAAITIVNEASVPVGDVTVTFSDAFHPVNAKPPMTTGFDGCLFVPNLEPTASLVVSISRAGYVPSPDSTTAKTLSISADAVTKFGFEYADAAGLKFTGSDPDFPLPPATLVQWKVKGTGGSVQTDVLTGSVSELWPGDEVQAWAGACTDSDPLSLGSTRASYPLGAGSTTTAGLPGVPLRIIGLKPAQAVTATHAASGCVDQSGDPLSAPLVLALGTSNENGVLRVSMPYGTWSFQAGTEVVELPAALTPPAPGAPPDIVEVPFLLQVDVKPTPTPTPTPTDAPSGTPTDSASPSVSPSEFPTLAPSSSAPAPVESPTDPGNPVGGGP